MKRGELEILYGILQNLSMKEELGFSFGYAIQKNLKIIENEFELGRKLIKPNEKYVEFNARRENLCKAYANKNASGAPIMKMATDGSRKHVYDIPEEKMQEFESEMSKILETHKDVVEEHKNKETEFFNTELDPDLFYKIKQKKVPKDHKAITPQILYWLMGNIIEDDGSNIEEEIIDDKTPRKE